jgi:hypothetical protein
VGGDLLDAVVMNLQAGAASSTAADTGAHCTISASALVRDSAATRSSSVRTARRTAARPASRSTRSSAVEARSESVMTTCGRSAIG